MARIRPADANEDRILARQIRADVALAFAAELSANQHVPEARKPRRE